MDSKETLKNTVSILEERIAELNKKIHQQDKEIESSRNELVFMMEFMSKYYEIEDRMDILLSSLYQKLGRIGVNECTVCSGTGGLRKEGSEEYDGADAWEHPAHSPCEDCLGTGRNLMNALQNKHISDTKRKRNINKFKALEDWSIIK